MHYERLKHYRHVRYMWIPYTPTVVAVVSNPVDPATDDVIIEKGCSTNPTAPLFNLLLKVILFVLLLLLLILPLLSILLPLLPLLPLLTILLLLQAKA